MKRDFVLEREAAACSVRLFSAWGGVCEEGQDWGLQVGLSQQYDMKEWKEIL